MTFLLAHIGAQKLMSYSISGVPRAVWRMRFPYCGGRYFRLLCRALSVLGLDRLFYKRCSMPLHGQGVPLSELKKCAAKAFSNRSIEFAFTWPSVSRSRGRCYAYIYDCKSGDLLGFAKIAYSTKDCAELRNEVFAQEWISKKEGSVLFVPKIVCSNTIAKGVELVIFEIMPQSADLIVWNRQTWQSLIAPIKDYLSSGTRKFVRVKSLGNSNWCEKLKSFIPDQTIEVCATHGDMAQHNFRRTGSKLWLFDWETFTEEGPILVDELTVYMSVRIFTEKTSEKDLVLRFMDDYSVSDKKVVIDVVAAATFISENKLSYYKVFERLRDVYLAFVN